MPGRMFKKIFDRGYHWVIRLRVFFFLCISKNSCVRISKISYIYIFI